MKKTNLKGSVAIILVQLLMLLGMGIPWVINLIKFINCDFAAPWKDEIIHLLGVLIPPASIVTMWF